MDIKKIDMDFSVCQVPDFSQVDWNDSFVFLGKTDEEYSLVCDSHRVPNHVIACEPGWKCFKIQGVLDFSLVGILAKISSLLAEQSIPIYAISTFNTDYVLVKKEHFDNALMTLAKNGWTIV